MPAHLRGMTDVRARSRVPAGVRTGGRFATEAHGEADVKLASTSGPHDDLDRSAIEQERTSTTVHVGGAVGPNVETYVAALSQVPGLGNVEVDVDYDEDDGRFAADVTIHGREHRLSRYERDLYRIALADGSAYDDQVGKLSEIGERLGDDLRVAHQRHAESLAIQGAQAATLAQFPDGAVRRLHLSMSRDTRFGVVEVGVPMPGDHFKVRAFGDKTQGEGDDALVDGELFAVSRADRTHVAEMTARQRTNRLNKVLDELGPDRETSQRYLRRLMLLARQEADAAIAADPILAGRP